jgi:phosphoserine phosphatase
MKPLADALGVDDVLSPALVEDGDRFTGALDGPPVGQEEKARRMRAYAAQHGIDLASSFAYGDSMADVPMLDVVGHGQAVNPTKALAMLAVSRGWPVHRWTLKS